MTTSSKLWVFSKLHVSLSLIYLLLLTPLITPSYSNVYHLGLDSLRMLYLGENPTCLIALSLLTSKVLKHLLINSYMMFLNDLFLVLYSSFYILLLSVNSYLIHLQVINSMLMTLNSIYHSRLLTNHTILFTLNKLYLISITGYHLTFFPFKSWISCHWSPKTAWKTESSFYSFT